MRPCPFGRPIPTPRSRKKGQDKKINQTVRSKPQRPVLRWYGGKWLLAPWIIKHLPPHRVYVEPFGGAASVLMQKPRAYAEIYNDLDEDVVNLFKVLRSARATDLIAALQLTPFSRSEFDDAYRISGDPMERARRLVIRSFMGFGSDGHNIKAKTGFRANSSRSGTTPARDWVNYPESLRVIVERLRGVIVENRDAWKCMKRHDGPKTLHYVDPPYLPKTRSRKMKRGQGHVYAHELNAGEHTDLLAFLQDLKGMVVVSGYPAPDYDAALAGWRRVERQAMAAGVRKRTEVLWINGKAWDGLDSDLFGPAGRRARPTKATSPPAR